MSRSSRRPFLRFAFEGRAYQYKVLPFGLSLSPRVFTKVVEAALVPLREQGVRILNYLDDWLILAQSRRQLSAHRDLVLKHLSLLGLRVNWEKSKLVPTQRISFLGMEFDSVNQTARLTQECAQSVLNCFKTLSGRTVVPLKHFQRLLGHMAAAAVTVPLGLLHMRPLQHWLYGRIPRWVWKRGTYRVQITPACVYQPARRFTLPSHVATRPPPPPLESEASEVPSCHPHPRSVQSGSRRAVSSSTSRRVETPSPGGSADLGTVRSCSGRPVCISRNHPLPGVLLPNRGNAWHGCTGTQLAPGPAQICVPPSEPTSTDTVQDQGGRGAGLVSGSILAQQDLVPGTHAPRDSPSLANSSEEGSAFSETGHPMAPASGPVETPRMVPGWDAEVLGDLPQEVALTIASARAPSMVFLPPGGPPEMNNLVVRFLRGARRLNPPRPPSLPSWDLALVLRALITAPFEPLQSVELKFLSMKTLLLTALASIKRVGDLQAFSFDDSCLQFGPADSSATLRPRPGYVPKVPTTPFRDQVVNLQALPPEEADPALALLCLVRALRQYTDRTQSFRTSEQLFVCYGGQQKGKAVSKQRMAHWIVDAITLAYEAQGVPCPLRLRAHSTRGVASSWALARGASLADICRAVGWATPNTFARFYSLRVEPVSSCVLTSNG